MISVKGGDGVAGRSFCMSWARGSASLRSARDDGTTFFNALQTRFVFQYLMR
jgi:hypothetical protein